MITKDHLIDLIEALQAKKADAGRVLRHAKVIEQRADIVAYQSTIGSICDRLCLNWNVLNGNFPAIQKEQAREFLKDALIKASNILLGLRAV
jgi:hypothetical protein